MAKQKKKSSQSRDGSSLLIWAGWLGKYLLYALCSEMVRRGEENGQNFIMAVGLYIEELGAR